MAEQTTLPEKTSNGTHRRWDPADMFQTLHQEMERIWPDAFALPFGPAPATPPGATGIANMPRMDVYEKGDMLVFAAELPGMKKEDVTVEVDGGYLVIKGEAKAESEVQDDAYYRMERRYGSFYRSQPLPFDVAVRVPQPAEAKSKPTQVPVA